MSTFHLELECETLYGVGKAKRSGEYQELHKIRLNWLTLFWWQSILQERDGKGSGMGAKWVADNNPWCTSLSLGWRAAPRVRVVLVQTGEIAIRATRAMPNLNKEESKRKTISCQRRM